MIGLMNKLKVVKDNDISGLEGVGGVLKNARLVTGQDVGFRVIRA